MAGELSGILEHVDRIAELDLEGVEPTSHVVELENVLRADEPRPSWPRERGPGAGARPGRRRLPRPLAAGRGLDGRAARADGRRGGGADRRRASSRRPSTARPGARPPPGDELNAYLWRVERRRRRQRARSSGPLARHPGRGQGHLLHRGHADHGRLADPRGLPAALHRDRRAQADRGRRAASSARPTWTSSRWAPRTRTPPTGRCSTPGTASASPAAPRAARRRRSPAASRPGRSAPTPAARSASPPRSAGSSG